jgi:peptidoglycan hydrolase-like protein with peptidoglycan-binding domain
MRRTGGATIISTHLTLAALAVLATPASAQLQIGGQPFQGGQAAPASESPTDELTQRIQRDLVALGYDPGAISGEMTVETAVAISQFQAANGMDVSGTVSPQLAGILAAQVDAMRGGEPAVEVAASASGANLDASQASENCTPKAAAAEPESSDDSGRLARAGSRLFNRFGSRRANQQLAEATATASDIAEVADIVSELTECEPQG